MDLAFLPGLQGYWYLLFEGLARGRTLALVQRNLNWNPELPLNCDLKGQKDCCLVLIASFLPGGRFLHLSFASTRVGSKDFQNSLPLQMEVSLWWELASPDQDLNQNALRVDSLEDIVLAERHMESREALAAKADARAIFLRLDLMALGSFLPLPAPRHH